MLIKIINDFNVYKTISEIKKILNLGFAHTESPQYIKKTIDDIENQNKSPFSKLVLTVEEKNEIIAFALTTYHPELNFAFLDCIAVHPKNKGKGTGQHLYKYLRNHIKNLGCEALFFECLTDEPASYLSKDILKENIARLNFYKKFNAKIITGSNWEEPDEDGTGNSSYLLIDNFDKELMPSLEYTKKVVRSLMENKFRYCCSSETINNTINSFKDDPIKSRPI